MIKKYWEQQLVRYVAIGALNTLIGYLLYCFFIFIGLHYTWAVLAANVLSVIINFNTQGRVVFEHFHRSQFVKYAIMVLVNYFLNILIIHLLYHVIPNYYIVGLIAAAILPVLSFVVSKYWIFVERR